MKRKAFKPRTADHSRGFALGAAVLLLLTTLFFLYSGLMLVETHVVLSSSGLPPIPGLNNTTKTVNGVLYTMGVVAVLMGILYLVATILVFSGNWSGFYSGVGLSATTLAAIAYFLYLLPSLLYIGLMLAIAPALIITFLLLGWKSFTKKPSVGV